MQPKALLPNFLLMTALVFAVPTPLPPNILHIVADGEPLDNLPPLPASFPILCGISHPLPLPSNGSP